MLFKQHQTQTKFYGQETSTYEQRNEKQRTQTNDADKERKIRALAGQKNMLARRFARAVKITLFKAYLLVIQI